MKYKLLVRFVIVFILMLCVNPVQSGEKILNIYSGVKIFNNPVYDSLVLLEFPIALKKNEFQFFKQEETDTKLTGRVFIQVDLIDSTAKVIDSASTYFALEAASQEEASMKNVRIFDRLSLKAYPGKYTARIYVIDVVSKNKGEFFISPFDVPENNKTKLSMSDYYLAYDVEYVGEKADTNFQLVKNGFRILPNPTSIFSVKDSSFAIYGELYNLDLNSDKKSKFKVTYNALNQDSSFFMFLGEREIEKSAVSAVIREFFDIKGWPANIYNLQIIAEDKLSQQKDTVYQPFAVIEPIPDKVDRPLANKNDPYYSLTLKERKNLLSYIISPEQLKILKNLSNKGQENYLAQFWKEHDLSPLTPENEQRLEYVKRYIVANRLYSNNYTKDNGWSSDRGRIYIKYGDYDEIDEVIAPRIGNSYEVWYYRTLGEGKFFVFEDWSGNYDYRLVHSNADGEIYSDTWQNILDQGARMDIE